MFRIILYISYRFYYTHTKSKACNVIRLKWYIIELQMDKGCNFRPFACHVNPSPTLLTGVQTILFHLPWHAHQVIRITRCTRHINAKIWGDIHTFGLLSFTVSIGSVFKCFHQSFVARMFISRQSCHPQLRARSMTHFSIWQEGTGQSPIKTTTKSSVFLLVIVLLSVIVFHSLFSRVFLCNFD